MGGVKVFDLLHVGANPGPNPETLPISFAMALAALAAPLLLLAFAFLPRHWANARPALMQRLGAGVALASAVLGVVVIAGLIWSGPVRQVFFSLPLIGEASFQVTLYLDAVSAVMFCLVSFLGAVVARYSCRYLDGDPEQGRFMKWLAITTGMVLLLTVSGNLLLFALAWMGTSLSLHQLLTFHGNRRGALLAARQKFVISRLGDLCLIAALVMVYQIFGTFDFATIFAEAEAMRMAGDFTPNGGWQTLAFLLVAGALLKSAQFPFHGWLPDTMETPTPVSALMHAGIINAGGFLIIRLSPMVMLAPAALDLLALVGAVTALVGALAMTVQPSIKRSLAYSTVGQMGFMMLQCGLGFFGLAMLHIVAHSLYKAHAFLGSGSGVAKPARQVWPRPRLAIWQVVALVIGSSLFVLLWGAFYGVTLETKPGAVLLGLILVLGVSQLLLAAGQTKPGQALLLRGWIMAALVTGLYFTLHAWSEGFFATALPAAAPNRGAFDLGLMAVIGLLFLALFILQTWLPNATPKRWVQRLYGHLLNGFYFDVIASRILNRFWPVSHTRNA